MPPRRPGPGGGGHLEIRRADRADLPALARLVWLNAAPEEQAAQTIESFRIDLEAWWSTHEQSHRAFIAVDDGGVPVGMAWVALLPRVPRPGVLDRSTGDIQSVFVVPEHRGRGIGSALVRAATEEAVRHGARRVTVHSGRRAVPAYERLGFVSTSELLTKEL